MEEQRGSEDFGLIDFFAYSKDYQTQLSKEFWRK